MIAIGPATVRKIGAVENSTTIADDQDDPSINMFMKWAMVMMKWIMEVRLAPTMKREAEALKTLFASIS